MVQKQVRKITVLMGYRIIKGYIQKSGCGTNNNKVRRKENWWNTTINQEKEVRKMFLDRAHKNKICSG
jgi:hypothetical protein